jgi:hypothetical protein
MKSTLVFVIGDSTFPASEMQVEKATEVFLEYGNHMKPTIVWNHCCDIMFLDLPDEIETHSLLARKINLVQVGNDKHPAMQSQLGEVAEMVRSGDDDSGVVLLATKLSIDVAIRNINVPEDCNNFIVVGRSA